MKKRNTVYCMDYNVACVNTKSRKRQEMTHKRK